MKEAKYVGKKIGDKKSNPIDRIIEKAKELINDGKSGLSAYQEDIEDAIARVVANSGLVENICVEFSGVVPEGLNPQVLVEYLGSEIGLKGVVCDDTLTCCFVNPMCIDEDGADDDDEVDAIIMSFLKMVADQVISSG